MMLMNMCKVYPGHEHICVEYVFMGTSWDCSDASVPTEGEHRISACGFRVTKRSLLAMLHYICFVWGLLDGLGLGGVY